VLEKLRYFIARDHETQTQVIAIYGTANVENAIVDIQYPLQADPHTGIWDKSMFYYLKHFTPH